MTLRKHGYVCIVSFFRRTLPPCCATHESVCSPSQIFLACGGMVCFLDLTVLPRLLGQFGGRSSASPASQPPERVMCSSWRRPASWSRPTAAFWGVHVVGAVSQVSSPFSSICENRCCQDMTHSTPLKKKQKNVRHTRRTEVHRSLWVLLLVVKKARVGP